MNEAKIPLEKTIVAQIMKRLQALGCGFVYKTHGSAYQKTGLPDIVAICHSGRFVGLEVKRPKIGRLTALQARTLNDINRAGGYACVVTSADEAELAVRFADSGIDIKEEYRGQT